MQALQAGVEGARVAYDSKIATLLAASSAPSPPAAPAADGAPALAAALSGKVAALLAGLQSADARMARALSLPSDTAGAGDDGAALTAAAATGQLPARLAAAGAALVAYAEVRLYKARVPAARTSLRSGLDRLSITHHRGSLCNRRRRGVCWRWVGARRRGGRGWPACRCGPV